jgi:hypothetical protein
METFATVDPSHLFLAAENHTLISSLTILQRDGGDLSSIRLTRPPPKKKYGLRSFVDGPAQEQDSWGVMDGFTMDDECQL